MLAENPTDDAGPWELHLVPDLAVPTWSGSQHEGPGEEQDLLGDHVTCTRDYAEAFLAYVISGSHWFPQCSDGLKR